jgi:hypothetical protein
VAIRTDVRPARGLAIAVLGLVLISCRTGPVEGWSNRARTMILTSGPTEISMSSSRVPGYWAELTDADTGSKKEIFLQTKVRTFQKGTWVRVEGPYGAASPAVFRDESGAYSKGYMPVLILVVWKMERSKDASRP